MNDLFSPGSFKRYIDLNDQVRMGDVEMGEWSERREEETSTNSSTKWRAGRRTSRQWSGCSGGCRRRTRRARRRTTPGRCGAPFPDGCGRRAGAKAVQAHQDEAASARPVQRLPPQAPRLRPSSSADRTRTSVVFGLGRKLKDITDEFQALRGKMSAEYKETVERRYFTITGKRADEQTIEQLISSGDSETFVQKAISEQGRGQVLDTISEIQERHDAVKEMEKNLLDLHQVFLDMVALVEEQGQQLNDIESNVAHANSFVRRGSDQLQTAREYQKSSRKWTCIAIGIGLVVVCLILVPITPSLLKNTLS